MRHAEAGGDRKLFVLKLASLVGMEFRHLAVMNYVAFA